MTASYQDHFLSHPGQLAEIAKAEEPIELLNAAARVAYDSTRTAAAFDNETAFTAFLDGALGKRAEAIDADTDRSLNAA